VNKTAVENVVESTILNDHDVILQIRLSTTCGSDLHLLGGYIPAMRAGDVLGHEFMGEVVDAGPGVAKHRIGDRVVVSSFIACGRCWYCRQELYSLCDNGNPNPAVTEGMWGSSVGGCFAYSHALGGFAGSHAEYIRVPYADYGAFTVPDGVSDLSALFASDAASTGWTGADRYACRKGGSVFILGVFGGVVDKFPVGAVVNKILKVMGAQMYGQRYIPEILGRLQAGELSTEHLATHILPLEQGPMGYEMFKNKTDGCVRVVVQP
jgi:threonine dehydrogenase-like Zn-dependent dehydrogenase